MTPYQKERDMAKLGQKIQLRQILYSDIQKMVLNNTDLQKDVNKLMDVHTALKSIIKPKSL